MAKIYATTNPEVSERELRNQERSRQIATQGMVLLANDGILPLKQTGKIALYGNGARNTVKGGTGSGDVNTRSVVNVEQGIEAVGFEVTTKSWLDRYEKNVEDANTARLKKIVAAKEEGIDAIIAAVFSQEKVELPPVTEADIIKECDTAIYVIARNSGEGFDRNFEKGDFLLEDNEEASLRLLTENYKNVIVILNVGGVMDTSFIRNLPGINAILLMSQAGNYGGHALADVLTGKVTPSGHLTTTWAKKYEDYPSAMTFSHMNGDTDDEYYTEGIYVGYRYFDSFNITPAYPFGYGLSYTDFDVQTETVAYQDGKVTVDVTVKNIGSEYTGKEVVQVYYSAPEGNLEKPYQELAAFAKTKELAPGEEQKLAISFMIEDMASYSVEKAAYILEKGNYYIRVGVNSRETHIAAALQISEDVATEVLSNRFALDCEVEEISAKDVTPYTYEGEIKEKENALVIEVPVDAIVCKTAVYRGENMTLPCVETENKITMDDVHAGKYTLDELVGQLTVEEMADLCIGTSRGGITSDAVLGLASTVCPGAAGDTTSRLIEDRNIRNMILADGPAGLRLSAEFKTDADGNILPGAGLGDLAALFSNAQVPEIPEDAVTYYQYTTAIPIATMLAQTWDVEAIEEAGNIVGEEMEEFGVTLWLAPGMNIHRNPLCGRNFEYYSEDPYVAGMCAAADTKGVQKHRGVGTTIKHFALNNQENNRFHANEHATERAIREIYLRGFEIAVKTAQPMAIMSSYNLLNGVHTANSYDLLTAVARDEWNFKGLVMTDWGTTGDREASAQKYKYTCSSSAACIKAGNDLIMPGSQRDLEEIVKSVGAKEGEVYCPITLADLQACTKRILNVVMKSSAYENALSYER